VKYHFFTCLPVSETYDFSIALSSAAAQNCMLFNMILYVTLVPQEKLYTMKNP
jgi:hypothetical protein